MNKQELLQSRLQAVALSAVAEYVGLTAGLEHATKIKVNEYW
jgi:hypothetical protein